MKQTRLNQNPEVHFTRPISSKDITVNYIKTNDYQQSNQ